MLITDLFTPLTGYCIFSRKIQPSASHPFMRQGASSRLTEKARSMDQPRLERPFRITLSLTERCNLKCQWCYSDCGARPASEELSTDQWRHVIDDAVSCGVIKMFIEGGEPLVREDALDLVRHATTNCLTYLRTNATLVTEDVARRLKAIHVGTVCVDLLGASADSHDALTGVPGSFDQAIRGVLHLLAVDVPVILMCILTRQNVNDLNRYLELAVRLGVGRVSILRLYPLGRAKQNWSRLSLSLAEMVAAISGLKKPIGLDVMHSWHPNNPNCCWLSAAARADGKSIGCPYLREYVDYGDLRKTSLIETWRNPTYLALRTSSVEGNCGGCRSTQLSSGGCRSTAYAFRGSFAAADPFCPGQDSGIDLRELPRRLLQEEGRIAGSAGPRVEDVSRLHTGASSNC
jgi:radical SAM protein with 4Fe4S-binding SPASM domain